MRRFFFVVVGVLAIVFSGCAAQQFIPGSEFLGFGPDAKSTVYFAKGDLEADVPHGVQDSYAASLDTLRSFDYTILSQESSSENCAIRAVRNGRDDELKINLRSRGPVTHISIRSGLFGNPDLSQDIFDDIESRLKG